MSHARKFFRDETQAEEIVQDAFLYLMTALPELDSELGVLRFLKWKTRMLCLDAIRSSRAGLNENLVPLPDEVPDESQPLDVLDKADDAAIVRLALAKLSSRHREALIATMYEEKSHEEVARQFGISENAFRQLLFRARASFRTALVGEAAVEGKTVSQILAIAAKKNARRATRTLGATLAVVLTFFLMLPPDSQRPDDFADASRSEFLSLAPSKKEGLGSVNLEPEPDGVVGFQEAPPTVADEELAAVSTGPVEVSSAGSASEAREAPGEVQSDSKPIVYSHAGVCRSVVAGFLRR